MKKSENSDLVNQIAEGTAVLLTAEDICNRLSVSRSTFDRWVRRGGRDGISPSLKELMENDHTSFPPPDIRIGNSPRWSIETFKSWLRKYSQIDKERK